MMLCNRTWSASAQNNRGNRLFADQSIWHLKAWTGGKKGWGVITDFSIDFQIPTGKLASRCERHLGLWTALCCLRLLASNSHTNPKQSLTLPLVPQLPPHQDLTPQYCKRNWSNIKILWYLISTILRRRRIISNIIHLNGLAHKMHSTCRKNFRRLLSTTHSNVVRFSFHNLSCYCNLNNKDILFHILQHYHFSLTKNIFLKFKQATPIILPEFIAT